MVALQTPEVTTAPGGKLTESAKQLGIHPAHLMRDYYAFGQQGDVQTIAVGDMANNLVGKKTYQFPELAERGGLPANYELNGGLAGSIALRQELPTFEAIGFDLIEQANQVLRNLYWQLGLNPDSMDPAELFTGYLAHARIDPEQTTITSVGDVYVWVNGVLVAGEEKRIDTLKEELVTDLVAMVDANKSYEFLTKRIAQFARTTGMNINRESLLERTVYEALEATDSPTRQTIYTPVDTVVTPWQIRELQNSGHELRYGAIDGTQTIAEAVQEIALSTAGIETLVIATDGSKPVRNLTLVRSAADLVAVNAEFSEQTIVSLHR